MNLDPLLTVTIFLGGLVLGYAAGTHTVPDTVSAMPSNYDPTRAAFLDAIKANDTCWKTIVNKLEKEAH